MLFPNLFYTWPSDKQERFRQISAVWGASWYDDLDNQLRSTRHVTKKNRGVNFGHGENSVYYHQIAIVLKVTADEFRRAVVRESGLHTPFLRNYIEQTATETPRYMPSPAETPIPRRSPQSQHSPTTPSARGHRSRVSKKCGKINRKNRRVTNLLQTLQSTLSEQAEAIQSIIAEQIKAIEELDTLGRE